MGVSTHSPARFGPEPHSLQDFRPCHFERQRREKPLRHTLTSRFSLVAMLLLSFLLLCLGTAWHSTAKGEFAPATRPSGAAAIIRASSGQQITSPNSFGVPPPSLTVSALLSQTAVFSPLINIIPDHNGSTLFISAGGIGEAPGIVFANLDIGPAHKKGGYAMTYSDTLQVYLTNAAGFTPNLDEEGTLSLTTTLGLATGNIKFQRAFIETTLPELIIVDESNFVIEMPNLGTVPVDVYLAVMSTNSSPGPTSAGYSLVSRTYGMRSSGALTQTEKLMTLKLRYPDILPNDMDPHTLTAARWLLDSQSWQVLGGDLFDDTNHLTLITRRLGTYALLAGPAWRDSFKEDSLTGISESSSTAWGPGDALILSNGAISGAVTSIPITPTGGAAAWGILHFSATTPPGTEIRVDVLNSANTVVLANVADGTDLAQANLTLAVCPTLKLRATLTSTVSGVTPALRAWSLSWQVNEPVLRRAYLPVIMK